MESRTVVFSTEGLLSKWGFEDGDLLMGFMNENGFDVGDYSHEALLVAAVRRFVIPRIRNRVEVEEVSTLHNPIRAVLVDGKKVDCFNPDDSLSLDPAEVAVSHEELIRLAEEVFGARRGS